MTRRHCIRWLAASAAAVTLPGCTPKDAMTIVSVASSRDPERALQGIATDYARNPQKLINDAKRFAAFVKSFEKSSKKRWGETAESPQPDRYVKYYDDYRTKSLVYFREGVVVVEALDEGDRNHKRLKKAIERTLLTPSDPTTAISQYDASVPKAGGEPFLYKQVLDHEGHAIRWQWRATRYAEYLLRHGLHRRLVDVAGKKRNVSYVRMAMVDDHEGLREQKYASLVKRYAARFRLPRDLVYAIIKTESDFNPNAINAVPAVGLMQVVPHTAGRDAYVHVHNRQWTPSKSYLFNPKNNIELGTAYLNLLNTRYLAGIRNSKSREHCMVAAYNTGAGNVLKAFHRDRKRAAAIINAKTPEQVYAHMRSHLPYDETRRYIVKVRNFRREFSA